MRVQIRIAAPHARHRERETNHFDAIEGADDLSTDLLGDHEKTERNQFRVSEIPDFPLQGDSGAQFLEFVTVTNDDCVGLHFSDFSRCFACCQRVSSSSNLA